MLTHKELQAMPVYDLIAYFTKRDNDWATASLQDSLNPDASSRTGVKLLEQMRAEDAVVLDFFKANLATLLEGKKHSSDISFNWWGAYVLIEERIQNGVPWSRAYTFTWGEVVTGQRRSEA